MKYLNIIIVVFLFGCNYLFSKEDIDFSIKTQGHLQIDNIQWYGDKGDDFISGYRLNNIKININAKEKENFCFLGFDYRDDLKLNNAFITIKKNNEWNFRIGKIEVPIGLEDTIDSEHRILMEPVLLKSDGKHEDYYGIEFLYKKDIFNVKVTIFEELMLYKYRKKKKNKTSWKARGFMNPNVENLIQHFGISYKVMNREKNISGGTFLKDNPVFNSPNSVLYSQIAILPRTSVLTIELIEIWKSLCVQGEMSLIKAHWLDYDKEKYTSSYIQLAVLLTGESHYYDFNNGVILNPIPKNSFGAFELALRINATDITNRGPLMRGISACDGKKIGITFGMNWYIGNNIRIQGNYTRDYYDQRLYNEREIQALGIRAQFIF